AVLPGVVLAYLLAAPFAAGALVFGLLAVALIGAVRERTVQTEDAVIGVVFTVLFALVLLLVAVLPIPTDIGHILFRKLLGVGPDDVVQVLVLAAGALAVLVAKRRDLTL